MTRMIHNAMVKIREIKVRKRCLNEDEVSVIKLEKDLVIRKDAGDGDDSAKHDAQVEVIIRWLLVSTRL